MSGCFLMRVFFGGIYPTDDVFVIILFFLSLSCQRFIWISELFLYCRMDSYIFVQIMIPRHIWW